MEEHGEAHRGDKVEIRAGSIRAEPGSTVGADRSQGKTVFAQQNNYYGLFLRPSGAPDLWRRFKQVVAFASGLALIATVIVISVRTKDMSAALYTFLRITMALGGAAFAVCIDGFLEVQFKTWLRATGGLAVFVIIFFCAVARPTASTPAPDSPASQTVK